MVLSLVEEVLANVITVKTPENSNLELAASVVDEIITDMINSYPPDEGLEDNMDMDVVESPYLKMRNERVALIQAEFRQQFPEFEKDLRGLRVESKGK